ncbi:MAG TPA: NmrA family NAD(P)-binding protein [Allosphingosinicella sp.]|nr:NmrA family NAD(P)-binding protein [Allosphingosinicella sp.]
MNQVAVFHATGAQGHAIAEQVEAAGFAVRRLSGKAGPGLTHLHSADEAAIARALDGTSGAVFTVPQDYRDGAREAYAERVVRASERAGLARLVVNMGGPVYEDLDHPISHDLRRNRTIFESGFVSTVVLQPTTFLDNLRQDWAVGSIAQDGVLPYPTPGQARISWISHRSLGDFAAAALRAGTPAGRFRIGGPAPLTAFEVAEAIGRAAGRKVSFVEVPREQFAASLNAAFGAPAGDHIAALYEHLATDPEAAAIDPAEWAPLGVTPEAADAWAARHDWRVPAAAQA